MSAVSTPNATPTAPRKYYSPLRNAQAAETQRRILASAATLFASQGYVATSLPQIADSAGVSVETVKLLGPKRALILEVFESAFGGVDDGIHVLDARAALTEPNPQAGLAFLDTVAAFIAESNARMATLWPALQSAAEVDAVVKQTFTEMQANRRLEFVLTVGALAAAGVVGDNASRDELADTMSFLTSPEGYLQLVRDAGWPFAHYSAWLARALRALVSDGR